MPTYEYKCKKCGHTFEALQSMKDEPLKKCPKCKGKVERMIGGGAGIIFKGKGFYQTDYKSSGKPSTPPPCASKGKSDKCSSCPASGD